MTDVKPRSTYGNCGQLRGSDYIKEQGMSASTWDPCQSKGTDDETIFTQERYDLKEMDLESNVTRKSGDLESIIPCGTSECGHTQDSYTTLQDKSGATEKKKTPMCLVNELARHHKIQPQYRLTEESGPAHQKTFVVCLKLGEENYSASGQSIKKAQHAAAQLALQKTDFRLPEPKAKVKYMSNSQIEKPITPTVELNALAMKLNYPPVYTTLAPLPLSNKVNDSPLNQHSGTYSESSPLGRSDFRLNQTDSNGRFLNADFQPPYNHLPHQRFSSSSQKFYSHRFQTTPVTHRVTLSVGDVFVTGEGPSPQAARHHAAQQALEELRKEKTLFSKTQSDEATVISEADTDSNLKSPVSLAHELALKLNQTVEFTVLNESGPPHMRNFVVQCKLGDVTTQGEGNCKKLAKKKSAEIMLDELKKVHPNGIFRTSEPNSVIHQRSRIKTKPTVTRKKPRNLVKDVTSASNGTLGTKPQDPISQLVQLQQARKEKEPIFTVVSERGIPRQSPEFVVEVVVGSITATGIGAKKKDAKRAAAFKALEVLGATTKCILHENESSETPSSLPNPADSSGRQMVPGLLLIGVGQGKRVDPSGSDHSLFLKDGNKEPSPIKHTPKSSGGLRPEIRLRYLAQVLEYEVEFSDFPKGKKGDFVSLVTLNTLPPQVSHGLGSTLDEAHDNAASNMLKLIADGALDITRDKENADEGFSHKQ